MVAVGNRSAFMVASVRKRGTSPADKSYP